MIIVHHYLDKQKFLDDLSYLYYRQKEKLDPYILTINGLLDSDSYVPDFLNKIGQIKDNGIQIACRRVAIARMYNVGVNYEKCHTNPSRSYISYCSNLLAVIEIHNPAPSTVLISKSGDILVDEGIIRLNGKNHYPEGWVARSVVDGKEGVYSNDGKVAIPFGVFDDISLKVDGMNTAAYKIQYKDRPWFLTFIFHVEDICRASKEKLMGYLEDKVAEMKISTDREMFFISSEHVIIRLDGPINCSPEAALLCLMEEELKKKLRPLTSSIIQEELDQRND